MGSARFFVDFGVGFGVARRFRVDFEWLTVRRSSGKWKRRNAPFVRRAFLFLPTARELITRPLHLSRRFGVSPTPSFLFMASYRVFLPSFSESLRWYGLMRLYNNFHPWLPLKPFRNQFNPT